MQPAMIERKGDFEFALFQEVYRWEESPLKEAVVYALQGEAKRIRPLIALEIALELNPDYNNFYPMIALELVHTSSLILDDLPLMDDAQTRRNQPALHCVFGETRAFLAAVGLISAGYEQLKKGADALKGSYLEKKRNEIFSHCLDTTTAAGGLNGAPLGQWLDLHMTEAVKPDLIQLMDKKTGVFFETAFVFGWTFGGGDLEKLDLVNESAKLFGQIFQVMDDFFDQEEDRQQRPLVNFVLQKGEEESLLFLKEKKERLETLLKSLGLTKLRQALLEPLESLLLLPQ